MSTSLRNFDNFLNLVNFLNTKTLPNCMNINQVDGYLCGLSVSGVKPPDNWRELIYNDAQLAFSSVQEKTNIHAQIDELFALHTHWAIEGKCSLPFNPVYTQNHEERRSLEQWARGFLQGYIVQEKYWEGVSTTLLELEDDALNNIFDTNLYVISAVADASYAVQTGTNPSDLPALFASLPDVIISWGSIGKTQQCVST